MDMDIRREIIRIMDRQNGNDLIVLFIHHCNCEDKLHKHPPSTMTKGPVIVITGTPGTGKSTHAELLVSQSQVPLRHINVSEYVKERSLYDGYDEEWQSYTVDEDRVRLI